MQLFPDSQDLLIKFPNFSMVSLYDILITRLFRVPIVSQTTAHLAESQQQNKMLRRTIQFHKFLHIALNHQKSPYPQR